jgi:hypothetical protein
VVEGSRKRIFSNLTINIFPVGEETSNKKILLTNLQDCGTMIFLARRGLSFSGNCFGVNG